MVYPISIFFGKSQGIIGVLAECGCLSTHSYKYPIEIIRLKMIKNIV